MNGDRPHAAGISNSRETIRNRTTFSVYSIGWEPQQTFKPLKHPVKMKNFAGLLIKISDFRVNFA